MSIEDILQSCIKKEPFVSHSGLHLGWKFDIDLICENEITQLVDALQISKRAVVAGIQTGGAKLVTASDNDSVVIVYPNNSIASKVQILRPLKYFSVTLVDDVVTTGRSMMDAEFWLGCYGIAVTERLVVLDRRNEFPKEANHLIEITSLFKTNSNGSPRAANIKSHRRPN